MLAAVAFVLVERRRGDAAMLPAGLFGSRLFSVLNVFTVLVYAALGGFTFFLAVLPAERGRLVGAAHRAGHRCR